jgi:AcrR family transcriptional regulator
MEEKKYHHGDLKNALIQAGVEILAKDGLHGLSLRSVARKAGVSHAAPYAHFSDKQALIAAISTEGYKLLYDQLDAAIQAHAGDEHRQLIEIAWTYVQFAIHQNEFFKIMFSGYLEQEQEYPEFVEVSQKTFRMVMAVVSACQKVGILRDTEPDLMAVLLWGQVHGVISLTMMGQVSHTLLERYDARSIIIVTMNQISLKPYEGK